MGKAAKRLDESLVMSLPLFADLQRDQVRTILDAASPHRHDPGTTVFAEGASATQFFLLLDGHVRGKRVTAIGELIPDGTFAKVRLTIRPGGVNGASPMDAGHLKASQSSDARTLDCAFTVVDGPHARRKFWQSFTVAGGKLDEKGQSIGWKISKSTFRALVDSALGLDPKDESPATKAKRVLPGNCTLNWCPSMRGWRRTCPTAPSRWCRHLRRANGCHARQLTPRRFCAAAV